MSHDHSQLKATQMLEWWSLQPDQQPMHRLREMLSTFNSAVMTACSAQTMALAELNSDLLVLARKAAATRDPKALVEVEFEMLNRMRQCVRECSASWTQLARGSYPMLSDPIASRTAPPQGVTGSKAAR